MKEKVTKSRRERQKEATREGILRAALDIARTQGWAAVTVRRVAEVVEYTPPIIYEYFANKGALLEELQQQGFSLLAARMQGVAEGEGSAHERAIGMVDAYLSFAYEQPELYQLMHGWSSADISLEATLTRASQVAITVQEGLQAWAKERGATLPDPWAATEICWGLLHGLVSVEMMGRIRGGEARVRLLSRQALEGLFESWIARE